MPKIHLKLRHSDAGASNHPFSPPARAEKDGAPDLPELPKENASVNSSNSGGRKVSEEKNEYIPDFSVLFQDGDSKNQNHRTSLRFTIWRYFMLFILLILALLWLFQIVFLQQSYRFMKVRDIQKVALSIQAMLNENMEEKAFNQKLDQLAFDNSMCILITDSNGWPLYSVEMMAGCEIHGINQVNLATYRRQVLESSGSMLMEQRTNTRYNTQTLLFGIPFVNSNSKEIVGFLFLNTSLVPLESTLSILGEQLLYISLILLIIGLAISFFMALQIAQPIVQITKSAERLGAGDYNIAFTAGGYEEADKLAATLNYASREISKVDTLRRDLISNISHDLRTPLTMVKAYAEMIRDLSGDNPAKREEHVRIIIEESDRLSALVNDILDLSKLEAGTQELNMQEFPIGAKLQEIMGRYVLLMDRGYQFHLELDDERAVYGDVLKLEQVLYNLINNAVNYTSDNKNITIRQENHADRVRIEIIDNGPGIPKEQLPLIFDRYYRTEKSKRDVIGTGLGLSIVKNVLKMHHFPFGVQSELGKGSTFWFEILNPSSKTH